MGQGVNGLRGQSLISNLDCLTFASLELKGAALSSSEL